MYHYRREGNSMSSLIELTSSLESQNKNAISIGSGSQYCRQELWRRFHYGFRLSRPKVGSMNDDSGVASLSIMERILLWIDNILIHSHTNQTWSEPKWKMEADKR